ncbi:pyridoxamine 5'-phosphate oxidase [Hellea balneolensis]|uniref:pyridoxamine 5'-phosphate oxidase n=1 Tax=Hellea balneolensis TaxID=287478 RepID=UPI0003F62D41|nr:pyridoxamine 5'-phosphate oxidase [Hellea balneolensis]
MPDSVIPSSPSADDYAEEGTRDLSWTDTENPIALFETWLAKAGETEPNDPHAMSVATVDRAGLPDVRIVLLKGFDDRGFVFYTNSESAKGEQLRGQGKAALCFHWKSQKRQVRVRGEVEPVSEAESDAYFASRAWGSRIGAWASDQSRPVADREALLSKTVETETRFEGQDVPRPPHWYGWRVKPKMIEFWQDGAFRLHDRIVFQPQGDSWGKTRLYP